MMSRMNDYFQTNKTALRTMLGVAVALCGLTCGAMSAEFDTKRPNIVYILADDLGVGDVHACNPNGKIATPNMDQLAAEGMRFTDAHSGSAVCTPTRYGILTGRYSWRTRLSEGVCWGYSPPLIVAGRMTVASMLKAQGYNTACVGKWHLGMQWTLKDSESKPNDGRYESWENIDFTKPIGSGPNSVGFDYFFGISASLDMQPYVYIENDRVTSVPSEVIPRSDGNRFWREGPIGEDFKHVDVLDSLAEKAVDFIKEQRADKPFFLYFPLTAPHKPIFPKKEFRGRSRLNDWGDFVMQVDSTLGRVMKAIESQGFRENTLIVFTSDNGASPGADFEALGQKGHDPSYLYRGHKADIFEGGHRVAFLARWPAVVEAGAVCRQAICHTDLLATAADITGFRLPAHAGEDSASILPFLVQTDQKPSREAIVHHSANGCFAIRRGKWKLCLCPGSGGWSYPRPAVAREKKLPGVQLYDLSTDVEESNNIETRHPDVVEELTSLLQRYIDQGRSTVGEPQENDRLVTFTRE